jgi:hypothetical protein
MKMRVKMSGLEFRRFMDGFGLTILMLGFLGCAVPLVIGMMTLFGVRLTATPSSAFQGLVLIALGGGLRLLVRIDKRLESKSPEPEVGVS